MGRDVNTDIETQAIRSLRRKENEIFLMKYLRHISTVLVNLKLIGTSKMFRLNLINSLFCIGKYHFLLTTSKTPK